MVKQEIQTAVNQGIKQPSLTALATKAGMSSFHFHRVFKARTGTTPEEYGKLVRLQEPKKE
jgi:AraC family transcriptional regulator of adaptative response/methylated-DNA-[protein]-cysteine methyltransferase